ncbi:MAG: hypothetical protein ABR990_15355 [Terracidiphilus sp.]
MTRTEQSEGQTGDEIVTDMREDARAEAATTESEQAEEHAEDGEQDHTLRAP